MSQATVPSPSIHPLPSHDAHHYGRAVLAAVILIIAIAMTLLVIAWTRDGTTTRPAQTPTVTHVAPTWNVPECPRIGYC
jgi:hypothetical protein